MWRALQNASRLVLVSMAFTMAFFLTPRSWISGARAPASDHQQVPVDTLEDSDSCLWCNERAPEREPCTESSDWFSPETPARYRNDNCDDRSGAGPNA